MLGNEYNLFYLDYYQDYLVVLSPEETNFQNLIINNTILNLIINNFYFKCSQYEVSQINNMILISFHCQASLLLKTTNSSKMYFSLLAQLFICSSYDIEDQKQFENVVYVSFS
ncbi:Hypothetical_protein [Hexamita inflata]|uniref:Hypothetical_protein n=1 Tax=Hexamita inflata TaxID=28002 RepID=A0ABP1H9E1_9EUKA